MGDLAQLGRPDGNDRLVALERAVADQQAKQVAFSLCANTIPATQRAVVMQQYFVADLQLVCRCPLGFQGVAGFARDTSHPVVRGQTQGMSLLRAQGQHRFVASLEKALALHAVGLAIDHGDKTVTDQVGHLRRPVSGHDPGVRGDARIGRADRLAVAQVVVLVDVVQKQDAGFGEVVGRAHDLIPQFARR